MTTLSSRIEAYILKRTGTTLEQLEGVVVSKGFTPDQLYTALDTIHRNKAIRRTVQKGDIVYSPAPEPKLPGSHLSWVREHYPWPEKFVMPFPEIDYSHLILKTKEERDAYQAAVKNMPVYMIQSKKHGKSKSRS